jgi:hypothetical protein
MENKMWTERQPVRFFVVELDHQSSSPWLGADAPIFWELFENLTGAILWVVNYVVVNSETSAVTSWILRICQLINFWKVLIKAGS